jgi:hypothetical protein
LIEHLHHHRSIRTFASKLKRGCTKWLLPHSIKIDLNWGLSWGQANQSAKNDRYERSHIWKRSVVFVIQNSHVQWIQSTCQSVWLIVFDYKRDWLHLFWKSDRDMFGWIHLKKALSRKPEHVWNNLFHFFVSNLHSRRSD